MLFSTLVVETGLYSAQSKKPLPFLHIISLFFLFISQYSLAKYFLFIVFILFIYLFISFLLTINLKLIIVHVEIKIVNKEAATKRSTLLHAQRLNKTCCLNKTPLNCRRRLKGIHSRSDTNRTGAQGLSFYYPRLLHCLDQMLAVMSLSQHRVSSSKTVRPRAPCGARCIGHAVRSWSAVCSEAPHSQFGEGARPHLFMDE